MTLDVPELDPAMAAAGLEAPVVKWGTISRGAPMPGTYHLYSHDYKFSTLIRHPEAIRASGCRVAVEPNFSTHEAMAGAEILWWTYQKRRIARLWQAWGVRILVDLNVSRKARAFNLLGVPRGWRAYATRAHRGVPFDALHDEFCLAADHAGTDDVLFCVFGGGRGRVGRHCLANGWAWVPEHRQVVAGLERAYEIG